MCQEWSIKADKWQIFEFISHSLFFFYFSTDDEK